MVDQDKEILELSGSRDPELFEIMEINDTSKSWRREERDDSLFTTIYIYSEAIYMCEATVGSFLHY